MKKRNFKTLNLNKVLISNILLGGLSAPESEEKPEPQSSNDLKCSPTSAIPNTNCTCA